MTTLNDIDKEILSVRESIHNLQKPLDRTETTIHTVMSARLQAYSAQLQALATLRLSLINKE